MSQMSAWLASWLSPDGQSFLRRCTDSYSLSSRLGQRVREGAVGSANSRSAWPARRPIPGQGGDMRSAGEGSQEASRRSE